MALLNIKTISKQTKLNETIYNNLHYQHYVNICQLDEFIHMPVRKK